MFFESLSHGNFTKSLYALSALGILIAFLSGPGGDYSVYIELWDWNIAGNNPWHYPTGQNKDNAYGPVFALFTFPAMISGFLPKILLGCLWACFGLWHWKVFKNRNIIWFWFLSPLTIRSVLMTGGFEILMGLLIIASLYLRKSSFLKSAFLLSTAVLTKFLPIIFFPFIAIENRKVNFKFLLSFIAILGGSLYLSYLIWGPAIFNPIFFASARESKLFSIFRTLRGSFSPSGNLDFLSLPLLVISGGIVFMYHLIKRTDAFNTSLLAIVVVLMFYKVGHLQFYLLPYMLIAVTYPRFDVGKIYYVWWNIATLLYAWTGGFHHGLGFIREGIGGIIAFVIAGYFIKELVLISHSKNTLDSPASPKLETVKS